MYSITVWVIRRRVICLQHTYLFLAMSSANIGQLMADMRQLVINLQTRERATDSALAKSQIINHKISGMKEYQEDVANMNECWRMQGRKVLVAGLRHENRQISLLQQENRELRQALEDCESTLHLLMQKHRDIVTKFAKQLIAPVTALSTDNKVNETVVIETITNLSRLLDKCFVDGENIFSRDQELIARLTTENACLRELLNISANNNPDLPLQFRNRCESVKSKNDSVPLSNDHCEAVIAIKKDPSSSTKNPTAHNEDFWQNSTSIPDGTIKKNEVSHIDEKSQLDK
ncbi:unnamed protein product [Thelazia callipaeda]|uniref:FGFR1 oncogene partner 2 homolog n=1 Tax=Thelazia callipaeda TaxID=103827 RepID=A0A0N5CZ33_THECL|nr:unnamed protein product [Thelazia callipaeda]